MANDVTYSYKVDKKGDIHQLRDMSHDDFFDWLACAVVMESDWEVNPGFYREVICRKLVRVGKLALRGDMYVLKDPVNKNDRR